jgi:hypothetical protein
LTDVSEVLTASIIRVIPQDSHLQEEPVFSNRKTNFNNLLLLDQMFPGLCIGGADLLGPPIYHPLTFLPVKHESAVYGPDENADSAKALKLRNGAVTETASNVSVPPRHRRRTLIMYYRKL